MSWSSPVIQRVYGKASNGCHTLKIICRQRILIDHLSSVAPEYVMQCCPCVRLHDCVPGQGSVTAGYVGHYQNCFIL